VGRNDSKLIYRNAFRIFGVTLLLTKLLFSFGIATNSFDIENELMKSYSCDILSGYSMLNENFDNQLNKETHFSYVEDVIRVSKLSVSRQERSLLYSKKI
jgi:hypothetical protein